VVIAHLQEVPDIHTYVPGTFNVDLVDPRTWQPPDDEELRLRARRSGEALSRQYDLGGDFLFNGNYVHPKIKVASINGNLIDGRVYYPGTEHWQFDKDGKVAPTVRTRIEILSKQHIRTVLKMEDKDEGYGVTLELMIEDTSPTVALPGET